MNKTILDKQLRLTKLMLQRRAIVTEHKFQRLDNASPVHFSAYRSDLLGKFLSGNKILKLAPNLQEYLTVTESDIPVATFGGSHSNHLRAFSAASRLLRLHSIVFMRESPNGMHKPLAETIIQRGCTLILLSPEEYKQREDQAFLDSLHTKHGPFHLISEGATSPLAVKHIANVFAPLRSKYSHAFVPVGLGGTLAGIIAGLGAETKVIGVSALKSDHTLTSRVENLLNVSNCENSRNWTIDYNYHFGGFGKAKPDLLDFASSFEAQTRLNLNQTYTMKSAFAMCNNTQVAEMERPLWINTFNPY